MSLLFEQVYNPDILNCLANLSNDEVFTPPEVVNNMLDMLPQELFKSSDTTFLDPACKTGVFLREIAKRLLEGLKDVIPDEDERRKHIFTKQLYGIAITEMTSLLSRRSLYCSKYANTVYSIVSFKEIEGNIRFKNMSHYWEGNRCAYCGASKAQYNREKELEQHAYEFVHTSKPEEIWNMQFDVIIGNPPYQLSTAGDDNGAQAKPIYQHFVKQALKLKPRHLCMIIPARWYAGGWGLDDFRNEMVTSRQIKTLYDYIDSYDCFPSLGHHKIKGGICIFHWQRDYEGQTNFLQFDGGIIQDESSRELSTPGADILIRYSSAVPILQKVLQKGEESFSSIVSTKKPFGMTTNYRGKNKNFPGAIKLYGYKRIEYIEEDEVTRNWSAVRMHKLITPKAAGTGDSRTDHIKPLYCEPGACCTETYLMVGPFKSKTVCDNVMTYIDTRFFHFLVSLQKHTQDCMKRVYTFVPMQDFSKPWTDEELYAKYGLSDAEVAYIESLIRPLD